MSCLACPHWENKVGGGKILITIGIGTGLIGLIIALYVLAIQKTMDISIGGIFGLVGIILSVVARTMAKKDDSPPQTALQYGSSQQQYYHQQSPPQQYPSQNAHPQQYQPAHQQPAPEPAVQPTAIICPTCGMSYRYIQQYSRYYCDVCGKYP